MPRGKGKGLLEQFLVRRFVGLCSQQLPSWFTVPLPCVRPRLSKKKGKKVEVVAGIKLLDWLDAGVWKLGGHSDEQQGRGALEFLQLRH